MEGERGLGAADDNLGGRKGTREGESMEGVMGGRMVRLASAHGSSMALLRSAHPL